MTSFSVIEDIEGIKIVPDISAAPGVDTLEGRIGPLLNSARGGAHYIEIPAGAYMDDHAHETESLIYTVRGEWVLCSRGQRWHMRTGSLFWFGDGIPTGYENPFGASACILIFKTGDRTPGYDAAMLERVGDIATKLEDEHKSGTPFSFRELPDDHPATRFARQIGV